MLVLSDTSSNISHQINTEVTSCLQSCWPSIRLAVVAKSGVKNLNSTGS